MARVWTWPRGLPGDALEALCEAGTLYAESRSEGICYGLTVDAGAICEEGTDAVVAVLVDGGGLGAAPPGFTVATSPRTVDGRACSTNEGLCVCGRAHMPGDPDVLANPTVKRTISTAK